MFYNLFLKLSLFVVHLNVFLVGLNACMIEWCALMRS